jgi:hypothetical protein
MATLKEKQAMMKEKLEAIRHEIAMLQAKEALLMELLNEEPKRKPARQPARQRSPAIKPLVIDYMASVGEAGATSKEVDEHIRTMVPSVAQDTVGSVLSRLKADGALVYEGERYYEKRFAPQNDPLGFGLRAVN